MGWLYNFRMATRPLRRKLRNFIVRSINVSKLQRAFAHSDQPRFILMLTPRHGNLGDHAITLGELKLLRELYPDTQVIEVSRLLYDACKEDLQNLITTRDIILIQGGGFFGSLYPESHDARRKIVDDYRENKVICFPVSIYYSADTHGQETLQRDKKVFSLNRQLTIMTRDEVSFDLAKREFVETDVFLTPDCAVALATDDFMPANEREGVVFVWRSDEEKAIDNNVLPNILRKLPQPTKYEIIDNVIKKRFNENTRSPAVCQQLAKISAAKVVVTDRFHGVVFAAITHTPVIAFSSIDTKITSGIKWFSDLPYVHLVEETEAAEELLKLYLSETFKPDSAVIENKKHILLDSLRKVIGKELHK
ncbi:putative pyruvyl transferase EpsI [bioreactor metagenome]|uniref:Putative pyruvyl transferase EpsI n=1 Tax=bioreactor metagenome TaxID=1076179 RepID=A0A645A0H8_9ZZZZ